VYEGLRAYLNMHTQFNFIVLYLVSQTAGEKL
jgi:hypothetical protein